MSATNRGSERQPADSYPTPAWCVRRLLEAVGEDELPRGAWLEPCAGEGAIVEVIAERADSISVVEIDPAMRPGLVEAFREARRRPPGSPTPPPASFQIADYLTLPPPSKKYDVIITNPPYSLALDFVRKAAAEAHHVAMLLRLNFLGSGVKSGRSDWLRQHPPDVFVLPNRPSFVASVRCVSGEVLPAATEPCAWRTMLPLDRERPGSCPVCGGAVECSTTDATEYAWFVWHPTRDWADPRQLKFALGLGGREHGKIKILADTPAGERRSP